MRVLKKILLWLLLVAVLAALIVGGAAAVGTVGAVAARYRFYQTIAAQEVEKALKPVHAQLDDLQATVDAMAEAEGLGAHAAAVRVRMKGGVL